VQGLEIIFISSDHDSKSFREYYSTMPWLAMAHGDPRKEGLETAFGVEGIPRLVLLDARTGRPLHQDARGRVAEDPTGSSFPWRDDGSQDDAPDDEEEAEMMVAGPSGGPSGGREPPKREVEAFKEEERICEVIQGDDDGGDKGTMTIAAALAEACVELGYDADNPKRKKLVYKLEGCALESPSDGPLIAL